MTVFLDLEDALHLCERLGVGPIRDLGLLDGAVRRASSTLYGIEAYPTLAEKGAALLESVVRNHALVDGNQRLGWTCLVVFLDLNGAWLEVADDDAYDLVVSVEAGQLSWERLTEMIDDWLARD